MIFVSVYWCGVCYLTSASFSSGTHVRNKWFSHLSLWLPFVIPSLTVDYTSCCKSGQVNIYTSPHHPTMPSFSFALFILVFCPSTLTRSWRVCFYYCYSRLIRNTKFASYVTSIYYSRDWLHIRNCLKPKWCPKYEIKFCFLINNQERIKNLNPSFTIDLTNIISHWVKE